MREPRPGNGRGLSLRGVVDRRGPATQRLGEPDTLSDTALAPNESMTATLYQ